MTDSLLTSHRRWNPLTSSWVLCSPHRSTRPWLGQTEPANPETPVAYDPKCYLCPGNCRSNGQQNPKYASTFVFNNDFSGLSDFSTVATSGKVLGTSEIIKQQSVSGTCRVLCFSPRHDLSIATMPPNYIESIIQLWKTQYRELDDDKHEYILIFENKGLIMGCSNPHPHGQLWASSFVPKEPYTELEAMRDYAETHGKCLLCQYVLEEQKENQRIVHENKDFIALVPYWAFWPFELLVLPKTHKRTILDIDDNAMFAEILSKVTRMYDKLFQASFPYSMGIHQSPTKNFYSSSKSHHEFDSHLHVHFYPPLLRSASVKKFYAGFELLGEHQRDLTPEDAVKKLKDALSQV